MNSYLKWRLNHPELGEFVLVPRCDDELRGLGDEEVAEMFSRKLREGREHPGGEWSKEDLQSDIAWYAIIRACCRELERRGREDLLYKELHGEACCCTESDERG